MKKTRTMRTTKIRILRWTAICSIPAIAVVAMGAAVFFRDKDRAYARIEGKSTVIPSPFGDIEYTQGGAGPRRRRLRPGRTARAGVLGDRFHWIAPSRFGYLRSTFNEGATFDDQAHAAGAHRRARGGVTKTRRAASSRSSAPNPPSAGRSEAPLAPRPLSPRSRSSSPAS
jgi:hypothetical protein